MNEFDLFFDSEQNEELCFDSPTEGTLFIDRPIINGTDDYLKLRNLPQINGVTLIGNLSPHDLGLQDICYGTTQHWASQTGFIPAAGQIVIYTDKAVIEDDFGETKVVPGIKIGDGLAYCVDLPFLGDEVSEQLLQEIRMHLQNSEIHVSSSDRLRWDNKVAVRVVGYNGEIIEFYRESEEK